MRPLLLACVLSSACVVGTKHDVGTCPREVVITQDSIYNIDKVYVSIELVLHASQMEKYPVVTAAFKSAMQTWADNLPIRFTLYVEDQRQRPTMPFLFNTAPPSVLQRIGVIQVLMDDLQSPSFSFPAGLVGLWDSEEKKLLLDADHLESRPDMAYSVSLHELGHLLGISHIVGFDHPAPTGYLALPEGIPAEDYVMFPSVKEGSQNKLSTLEIAIARHYVLYRLTDTSAVSHKDNCMLTTEH